MGNSASNANNPPRNPPAQTSMRQTSTSPGPGNPHPSMRTKKRSLELPDLASLSLTPASNAGSNRGRQAKSASIPIPPAPQNNYPFNHYLTSQELEPEERATTLLPSTSDMLGQAAGYSTYQGGLHPPSTHQPFPPAPRGRTAGYYQGQSESSQRQTQNQSAPRGRQQAIPTRQQQQIMRIQELYDRSQQQQTPAAPPSSPAGPSVMSSIGSGYPKEVVRSSIPVLLGKSAKAAEVEESAALSPQKEDLLAEPVPVKIVWRGGGKDVVLARAGDDEWKGRQPMERDPVNPNVWTLTVHLRPGTHHVRFFVDGQWRVADDLPAAVDDQGSLANYVAVPLTYGLPGQTQAPVNTTTLTNTIQIPMPPPQFAPVQPPRKVQPGQSFWSADSSADGEDERRPSTSSGAVGNKAQGDNAKALATAAAAAYIQAPWTNVFPPELLEAAREEEAYLAASAGQYDSPSGNTARVSGFVPAPNIPPAPGLPRHLDKLILNSRVGEQKRGEGSVNGSSGHGHGHRDRGDHGHRESAAAGSSGVGSGQGSSARRERRERERERERERGTRSSRRGNVPPPPPPSEDGGEYEPPMISVPRSTPASSTAEVAALPAASSSSTAPGSGSASGTTTPSNTTRAAAPPTTLASTSAGTISGGSVGSGGVESTGTTTAATSPQGSQPATPTGQMSPMQTPPKGAGGWAAGGVGALPPSALLSQQQSAQASAAHTPSSQYPQPPAMERAAVSASRAITIDDANMPALTDDNSVLPVPSHVVLHHLCTSAIKNGVLAVANTTRYRKKYLTTIYYKPT